MAPDPVPVPDPGPAPVEPDFPLEEARAASRELGELLDALAHYHWTRSSAVSALYDVAAGACIDRYRERDAELGQMLFASYQDTGTSLGSNKTWLDEAIATAEVAHDLWVESYASWRVQHADHVDYVRSGGGPIE